MPVGAVLDWSLSSGDCISVKEESLAVKTGQRSVHLLNKYELMELNEISMYVKCKQLIQVLYISNTPVGPRVEAV